jgi:hypothetical protein
MNKKIEKQYKKYINNLETKGISRNVEQNLFEFLMENILNQQDRIDELEESLHSLKRDIDYEKNPYY